MDVERRREAAVAAAIFLAALAVYAATLAPGLLWGGGDFARYQTWAALGRTEADFGVFVHVLWVYMAHPFTWLPIRDPAWRANLASAVFAAGALVFVYRTARLLVGSRLACVLGVAALGVSHTFWTYAVMAKVYSLNALLLAASLFLLLRWRRRGTATDLALAAALFGLGFLNHLVTALAAAGFAVLAADTLRRLPRRERLRSVLVGLVALAVGGAPFLWMAARAGTAGKFADTVTRFLSGTIYTATHPAALAKGIGWAVALGLYQFPLTWIAAVAGVAVLWRRDRAVATALLLVPLATLAFLLGALDPATGGAYVWNLHYYLQAYVVVALFVAAGLEPVEAWARRRRSRRLAVAAAAVVVPVALYAAAPAVARRVVAGLPDFRPLPGRDNLTYVLSPWKQGETGPRAYVESVLRALPHGSVLFADYGPWAMLRYVQVVEKARPDVEVVQLRAGGKQVETILRYRDRGDLFLADTYRYYDLDAIRRRFRIVAAGPIHRLEPVDR